MGSFATEARRFAEAGDSRSRPYMVCAGAGDPMARLYMVCAGAGDPMARPYMILGKTCMNAY